MSNKHCNRNQLDAADRSIVICLRAARVVHPLEVIRMNETETTATDDAEKLVETTAVLLSSTLPGTTY